VPSNWRDLLSEFNVVDPPPDLWPNAVARAQPGMGRRRIPRLPQRVVHALIAAAVIGAAVLGMLFASLLHHDAAPVGPARQPSKVGAQAWLGVLAADVQHRITLSRALVRSDQCFTPQWQYLATPIFIDMTAYNAIGAGPDPRQKLGEEYTNLNNRCSVYERQGGFSDAERSTILGRLAALDRQATALLGAPTAPPASMDPRVGLMLQDIQSRIPVAQRLIANGQCGGEVQKIAAPIQSDINYALLYAAPQNHTVAEGVSNQPLLKLGPDFMRIVGPCHRDVHAALLSDQRRAALTRQVLALDGRVDRALGSG
jgi:hypothetical protein